MQENGKELDRILRATLEPRQVEMNVPILNSFVQVISQTLDHPKVREEFLHILKDLKVEIPARGNSLSPGNNCTHEFNEFLCIRRT